MTEPKIIYEDPDLLALDKPAGVDVVMIAEWLTKKYPGAQLAHRLDKDTTGVLLVAKNQSSLDYLKHLFQTRQIKKTYLALVYGLAPERGTIDRAIGRSRKDPRRRIAGRGASGKLREALTYYQRLENLGDYSWVEIKPQTGRTHQIRVHFKAINHPVVCDELYASGKTCPAPLARQALHASRVEFQASNGQVIKLEAPLPADLLATLDNLRGSC